MTDSDSKSHITKIIPFWKLAFWQPIVAKAEVKVSVNLAIKYNVKAENFIIPIFYFVDFFVRSLDCCNISTIYFFILVSFFFEDSFKSSKK